MKCFLYKIVYGTYLYLNFDYIRDVITLTGIFHLMIDRLTPGKNEKRP